MSATAAARKRAEKTARRKKQLADRHRAEIAESRDRHRNRMQHIAAGPIYKSLLQKQALVDGGIGMLVLARKPVSGTVALSVFMLDRYCLGAKNAFFIERDAAEADWVIDSLMATAPAVPVDPGYARKLLHELVVWSRSLGLEPHKDYAEAEALFGDVSTEGHVIDFPFGLEGKPVLVQGLEDTPAQFRRWRERLDRTLGEDGYEWMEALDEDAELDDELDEDVEPFDDAEFETRAGLYDPAIEPEAKAWLALEEDERLLRIEAYHRLADISVPDGALHALFHMIVENQIAQGGETPVQRTVARLIDEGLDRHQAVHAIGSRLAEQLYDAAQARDDSLISSDRYFAAVQRLTAEEWRKEMETDEEPQSSCIPTSLLRGKDQQQR